MTLLDYLAVLLEPVPVIVMLTWAGFALVLTGQIVPAAVCIGLALAVVWWKW